MEKYLDKNGVLRLLQGVKTQINKSKETILNSKGIANGIASLDGNGFVPLAQLGNLDTTFFEIVEILPDDVNKIKKHIYIMKESKNGENNKYAEYIYTGDLTDGEDALVAIYDETKWEKLGDFVPDFDLKEYSKKEETLKSIDVATKQNSTELYLQTTTADGKILNTAIPTVVSNIAVGRTIDFSPGTNGLMSVADKYKLDQIDLDALTASINNANTAASNTNTAITKAEQAAAGAETVDAALDGNVLTVTNRKGEKKSVNLTDSDEHVTVNFFTTVEGASVEGLIVNVYINGGADPLQYISDSNGQVEFTVTKGATYKVVFPYLEGCNILNPVQHVASVGNRIIDAAYVAETEKVERVTIKVSKAEDATSQATAWEGITVHVTVGGVKTDYTTDSEGKVIIEVKNGTSYTVAVDKIDGMYEQYDSYSRTRTAIAESYRQSFIFRNYESGIWLIDDENKQWTYDDWEASGNDASKLMFVRIATLATQRYQGDIIMSIDKMADFAKVAVSKQWCNQNVQFNNIPLNGRDTNNSNWSKFAYNGLLATQTIIAEGDERELSTPAADYCYGITISNGDKTYQGYLPTAYQWEVAWSNFDILVEGVNMKYPELQLSKSMFSGNKWTSTQYYADYSYCLNTAVFFGNIKNSSYLAIPFFACLSTSPSLLSLHGKEDGSEEAA